jgi:threonine/homoserine/homoserine lactone efflux protein
MVELMMIFAKGFVIGLSLALVIGPIAILCIQQTLVHGFYAGIACGLGVATADGLYGALAGLGLSFITDILYTYQFWFHLFGGCTLLYLGVRTFNRPIAASSLSLSVTRFFNIYFSTCALTLSNPITLLSLSALLASLDVGRDVDRVSLLTTLFFGFFLGSLLWWVVLTSAVTLFRSYISIRVLTIINKIAGITMILFGLSILLYLLVDTYYR